MSKRLKISIGRSRAAANGIAWALRVVMIPIQWIDGVLGWPFTEPNNRWRRKANWIGRRATARLWFRLMQLSNRFNRSTVLGDGPPVSLTTYGSRIPISFAAVESIGLGLLRPSRLVLWLDDSVDVDVLDHRLKRLIRRGLEVRFTADYGPHKKYYPFVRDLWDSNSYLVTADDDIIYPANWLKLLRKASLQAPDEVNCHRARIVQIDGATLGSYSDWPNARSSNGGHRVFATGTSGVMYPPRLLHRLKELQDVFLQRCPRADDIWLHAAAVESGIAVRQIRSCGRHFPVVVNSQIQSLQNDNVRDSGNDRQIAATYFPETVRRIVDSPSI